MNGVEWFCNFCQAEINVASSRDHGPPSTTYALFWSVSKERERDRERARVCESERGCLFKPSESDSYIRQGGTPCWLFSVVCWLQLELWPGGSQELEHFIMNGRLDWVKVSSLQHRIYLTNIFDYFLLSLSLSFPSKMEIKLVIRWANRLISSITSAIKNMWEFRVCEMHLQLLSIFSSFFGIREERKLFKLLFSHFRNRKRKEKSPSRLLNTLSLM